MRLPITLPVLAVSLLLPWLSFAAEPSDAGLHTFYGEVVAIDPTRKVLQLKSGKQRFLFHYNDQTRITSTSGKVNLGGILRGTGAAVVMRVGEGNSGIAVQIRFVPNANKIETLALMSGRTVSGDTIKGLALSNFIDYRPPSDAWSGGAPVENRKTPGLCVLSIAPDGTVSNVTIRVSTGYPELDLRGQKWMAKWRFRPNTLAEVQLPMYYYYSRY